jgi:hypothetical protein
LPDKRCPAKIHVGLGSKDTYERMYQKVCVFSMYVWSSCEKYFCRLWFRVSLVYSRERLFNKINNIISNLNLNGDAIDQIVILRSNIL